MNLQSKFHQWIDPGHLIPWRAWLRVISIGLLSGLLFLATVFLAFLKERSISQSIRMNDLTHWTLLIGREMENMRYQVDQYAINLEDYITKGRTELREAMQINKAEIENCRVQLDTMLFIPENRKVLLQIAVLNDSSFAIGDRAVELENKGEHGSALQALERLKSLDLRYNFLFFSNKIFRNRGENLYRMVQEDTVGNGDTYRRLLIPVIILAGLLFIIIISSLVVAVKEVMRMRSASKILYEEEKKSANLARNLMNLAMVGYHSVGSDGIFIEINQTELDWIGYSREEVIGKKHFSDFYEPASDMPIEAVREKFLQDGYIINLEMNLISRSGEKIPALFNSKAIFNPDGSYSHSISTVFNFSERKKLETDLIKARQEAEHANHMKQIFMANMSHEIRTPLNAIIGFSNLLARSELPAELSEYVENIQTSGTSLLSIVNDILDFEKIRAGELHIDQVEFDLKSLLHSVITMLQPSARDKKLALFLGAEAGLPSMLLGDPMRLTQILVNLLGNAVKFTEKGHVTLRVSQSTPQNSSETVRIRFDVEDTGIGIPPSEHDRVFNRFSQANADTSRKFGGTGLGLALVKMLVDMQGGSIVVSSAVGQGSVFSVELPYRVVTLDKPEIPDKPIPRNPELPDLSGHKILLVEDNPINSRIAELYFHEMGLQVSIAENGKDAVEKLSSGEHHFDMVFMDIQMPEMDGYAATRYIRTELGMTDIPIIAMTAHVLAGERENVLSSGMNDYLSKPINHRNLVAILLYYLTGNPEKKL